LHSALYFNSLGCLHDYESSFGYVVDREDNVCDLYVASFLFGDVLDGVSVSFTKNHFNVTPLSEYARSYFYENEVDSSKLVLLDKYSYCIEGVFEANYIQHLYFTYFFMLCDFTWKPRNNDFFNLPEPVIRIELNNCSEIFNGVLFDEVKKCFKGQIQDGILIFKGVGAL
jgi:hypothetical protein